MLNIIVLSHWKLAQKTYVVPRIACLSAVMLLYTHYMLPGGGHGCRG